MTRYVLKDVGCSFKKIMKSREWVGRVVKHATEPRYLGIIGSITVSAASERQAFYEATSRAMGFESLAARNAYVEAKNVETREHNRTVRAANKAGRDHARYVVDEFLRGNHKPLGEAFERIVEGRSI